MQTLTQNESGGLTYATTQRTSGAEHRSDILADLRMTIDALSETCLRHQQARDTIAKLLDMLAPGDQADAMRASLLADLQKIDQITNFNTYIIRRVRAGAFKRFAELFDQ